MEKFYDLIIVGGGPAGLSAAIYAGRSERQTLLLEKGSYGGRINDTYEVRNYPGTVVDSGQHLMERFHEHALSHPTVELKRDHSDWHKKRRGSVYRQHQAER